MIKRLILPLLALLVLPACETTTEAENFGTEVRSVADAGVTSLEREPVIGTQDQVKLGDRTLLVFGKEYGRFKAKVAILPDGTPSLIEVEADEVAAFAGQQIGAAAAVAIQEYLTEQNIEISREQAAALTSLVESVMRAAFPTPTLEIIEPDDGS